MLIPLNDFLIVECQLTQNDIDYVYPISPTGTVNMDESELQRYQTFNPKWTFEEAKTDPVFFYILYERIAAKKHITSAKIVSVSKGNKDIDKKLVGKTVLFNNVNTDESFSGAKYDIDLESGIFKTVINPNQIMAIMQNEQLIPLHNYVELEFDLPDELKSITLETGFHIPAQILDDGRQIDSKDIGLDEIRIFLYNRTLSQSTPIVTAVYDENKCNVKVGDKVLIVNDYNFNLGKMARIDYKKQKVYFIKPETILMGVYGE